MKGPSDQTITIGNHNDPTTATPFDSFYSMLGRRDMIKIGILFAGVAFSCLVLYHSVYPFQSLLLTSSVSLPGSSPSPVNSSAAAVEMEIQETELERVLRKASMKNRTVIITTLNEAWAEPDSTFDLFLESFEIGQGIKQLLNHVVVACLDNKAYARCLSLNLHCYELSSNGTDYSAQKDFMTPDYLLMMWRRIEFLTEVLQTGYNFIFTDADIMWFRDPFPHLYPDIDFQMACDHFFGDPRDSDNWVNGGFTYNLSNNRTIAFYKYWYASRLKYPGKHDQDVFNEIKHDPFIEECGVQMRFFDTVYFGGFCQPSRDINLVCTMHANCCIGLDKKIHDLNLVLDDWRNYTSVSKTQQVLNTTWSVPNMC